MKKPIVWLLVTVIIVSITTVAFASLTDTKIEVSFRNIKIIHNGQEVQASLEPFIYNGHVYVSIRDIAKIFSIPVSWDEADNSVILGTRNKLFYTLSDINFLKEELEEQNDGSFKNVGSSYNEVLSGFRFATIKGRVFKNALYFGGMGKEYFIFPLNNKFSSFSFIAGATDNSQTIDNKNDYAIIKIYGDTKLLYESPPLNSYNPAILMTIPVKNVQVLKIEKELHGESIINVAIANSTLKLIKEK